MYTSLSKKRILLLMLAALAIGGERPAYADDTYYQYDKHWPDGSRMGIPTYEHHPDYDVFRELDANGNVTYEHREEHASVDDRKNKESDQIIQAQ